MILVQKNSLKILDFEYLLENTKTAILTKLNHNDPNKIDAIEFETLVCETMKEAAKRVNFDGAIFQTRKQQFPDIIANTVFGVEVKTAKNSWESTGNSILESTRVKLVEMIYMFYCRFGNFIDIKYKPYQECLANIIVTHSPRYQINMDLSGDDSIFARMKVSYDDFRSRNPIQKAKEYYKKHLLKGESLWWIGSEEEIEKVNKPLIIKTYETLDKNSQDRFRSESMAFFPEIFSNDNRSKYSRVTAYLLNKYNAVSSSLRDKFTANGQVTLEINGIRYEELPHVYSELQHNAQLVRKIINESDVELLKEHWEVKEIKERETRWLELLNRSAANLPADLQASDIYRSGLVA
jgi:hypothetical protein